MKRPLILIKGAGDLASGIALRLYRSGLTPIMTELAQPTAVRRTVAFSEAITTGYAQVEDCRAVHAAAVCEARRHAENHVIAVLTDEPGISVKELQPDVLIDAIIAKRNLGTALQDAPAVIAVGPGFTAGVDCHAVVETARGHTLGRVYYADSNCRTALPNTGIPGEIGGFTTERLIRSPADGVWRTSAAIGDYVHKGECIAAVEGRKVQARLDGIVRGLLPEGFTVQCGMKCGDIDPRCQKDHCWTVSDKALAIGGGVLEALYALRTAWN